MPPQSQARRATVIVRYRNAILGALKESVTDRVSLAAAGCAFYTTLSLFPAISMLISIYGLVFDVQAVEEQLRLVKDVLPPPAFVLIDERIHQLVVDRHGALSIGFLISLVFTFWSAATGTKSMLSALNVAYDVTEQRSIIRFQLIALLMTLCGITTAGVTIAVLVFLPVALGFVGLSAHSASLINAFGSGIMVLLVLVSIALLYRFGPSRDKPPNQRIAPGALLATGLWLAAALGLSYYVSNIASFGITYGSLGAVVAVMLWFYISAYAVLLGAEMNAQLEQQATRA